MSLVRVQTTLYPEGLGDIAGDISALVSLASMAGSSGGITQWMQQQIARFSALPQTVQNLQAVITTLAAALTQVGLVPAAQPGFTAAQVDLTNISAGYPAVQADLGAIGVTLYPALAANTFTVATITTLSAQGLDVLGTFNGMQTLFGYAQDAQSQLATIATNPALPASVQAQVQQMLAEVTSPSSSKTLTGYLIIGGVGYVLYRLLKRVF